MEKLNQWVTLLTNIGVLVGLVVLVYEINQNTRALQNETDVAIYGLSSDAQLFLAENDEIVDLVVFRSWWKTVRWLYEDDFIEYFEQQMKSRRRSVTAESSD